MFFIELKKIVCIFFLCNSIPLFGMEEKRSDFMLSLKQVCKKVVLDTCIPEEVVTTLPNDLVDELCDYAITIAKGLLVSKGLRNGGLGGRERNGKFFNLSYEKDISKDENRYPQHAFYENDSSTEVVKNTICFNGNDDREMLKRIAHFSDKSDLIQKIYDAMFVQTKWRQDSLSSLDITEPLRIFKVYKLIEYWATPSRKMVNLDYLHGLFEGHRDEKHKLCLQWQVKNLINLSGLQSLEGLYNPRCSVFLEENNSKEKSEITNDNKNWLPFFIKLNTKAFCCGLSLDRNNKVNEVDFRNKSLSKNVFIVKAFLMPYIANLFFKQKQARRTEKDNDPSRESRIPSVGGVPYVSAFSKLFDTFDGTKKIYFHMNYHRYSFTRTLYAPLRRLSVCYKKNKLPQRYKKGHLNLFDLDYTNLFELFKTLQQESNNYRIATIHSLYGAIASELSEIPYIDINFSEIKAQALVDRIREIIVQKDYKLVLPDDHYYILNTSERTTAKNRDAIILKAVREYLLQVACSYREKVGKCALQ